MIKRESGFVIPTVITTSDENRASVIQKRRLLDEINCQVSEKMLETTKINIQNPEHAKIVTNILKKKPAARFDIELQYLNEAFENIQFFENIKTELSPEDVMHLLKRLTVEEFTAGQSVFNLGDWGDKFYIIIQGAVYILLKKNAEPKEAATPRNPGSPSKSKATFNFMHQPKIEPSISLQSQKSLGEIIERNFLEEFPHLTEEDKLKAIKNEYPGFFIGRIMETGAAFGEIALQNKVRRTAAVVCKENTIFGVLTREDYNRLLCKTIELRNSY